MLPSYIHSNKMLIKHFSFEILLELFLPCGFFMSVIDEAENFLVRMLFASVRKSTVLSGVLNTLTSFLLSHK